MKLGVSQRLGNLSKVAEPISEWHTTPRYPTSSDFVRLQVILDTTAPIAAVFLNIDDALQGATGATLFDYDTIWRFWKGTSSPGLDWTAIDFDGTHWRLVQGGLGYGDTAHVNLRLNDMHGNYTTVYLRKEFTLASVPAQQAFFLEVFYDDGFICYINGQEAVRENGPETVTHTALATGSHESEEVKNG